MNARHTLLVNSALGRRQALLEAARERRHGLQVLTPTAVAARLAGGFADGIDTSALQVAVREALDDPALALGDLDAIRKLPGMARALVTTLRRAWLAGIDIGAQAASAGPGGRLAMLHRLEQAVLERLPPGRLRPADLVARADFARASSLLGAVTVRGVPDLDPAWRPLVLGLADVLPVTWRLGHVQAPAWLAGSAVQVEPEPASQPAVSRVSCANPRHEALEALRWARGLLALGRARPEDILIAAPSTHDWDDHLAAMAADANLPLAFVHGRPAVSTRDGQATAALAEVLVKGLSRARVRRLLDLVRGMTPPTRELPDGWHRVLPEDAPLLEVSRWQKALDEVREWPEGNDFRAALMAIIHTLDTGPENADEVGRTLLSRRALALWQTALRDGPAEAIDVTLAGLRVEDDADPAVSIAWCSAAEGAAAPRPFVRLLGLTSRGWPRTQAEDPLLPAHVIDPDALNPVPVPERDRRDYRNLLGATRAEIVLSRSRRDAEGRLHGPSALLREGRAADLREDYLRREAIPPHAVSEADRCLARPAEFTMSPGARSARACWQAWHREGITAHDGLVRPDHPVLLRVLEGRGSASRLRLLLRDPLGFVWKYALGWRAPPEAEAPLTLDPLQFGNLAHQVLEVALAMLGPDGLVATTRESRAKAVERACMDAAAGYEARHPVPPRLMWRRTLEEAGMMTRAALDWPEEPLSGQRSFGEVSFGGVERAGAEVKGNLPWDPQAEVRIPGTTLTIGGSIDRLDLSADGRVARVTDYKTGKTPGKDVTVGGGAELQRCLYASAVRVLLGPETEVEARLLYLRDPASLQPLANPAGTLDFLAPFLQAAHDHVAAGHAVIGPDSGSRQDNELSFALPGNAKEVYLRLKMAPAGELLSPLPELWVSP